MRWWKIEWGVWLNVEPLYKKAYQDKLKIKKSTLIWMTSPESKNIESETSASR